MVEYMPIQQRGFHNICDENGEICGFQFKFVPNYYKGLWFSQVRIGNVEVDGEVFDRDSLIFEYNNFEYTREEFFSLRKYMQFRTPLIVKVPKAGGLSIGYHEVKFDFGWVLNYNGALEKEPDGSGLGNMAHMFGAHHERTMLLCR